MFMRFFKVLKNYKDLIGHLILFELKSNVARTYLGLLWWILDPLLYMAVFYIIVQVILHRGGPDYSQFLFTVLIPLKWTISCLVDSTNSIASKRSIINQIYVPKVVFVIVKLGINTVKFLLGLLILFVFLVISGVAFGINLSFLPIIIMVHALFLFSVMIILAHIGVYFKDIRNMMQYISRMLYYFSPVLFSVNDVPERLGKLLYLNPLTTLFESYRNTLMYGKMPQFTGLIVLTIAGLILLNIGMRIMEKYDKKYVKVI